MHWELQVKERNDKLKDGCISDELVVNNAPTRDVDLKYLDQDSSANSKEAEHPCLVPIDEGDCTSALKDLQPAQVTSNIFLGISSLTIIGSISNSLFLN